LSDKKPEDERKRIQKPNNNNIKYEILSIQLIQSLEIQALILKFICPHISRLSNYFIVRDMYFNYCLCDIFGYILKSKIST